MIEGRGGKGEESEEAGGTSRTKTRKGTREGARTTYLH